MGLSEVKSVAVGFCVPVVSFVGLRVGWKSTGVGAADEKDDFVGWRVVSSIAVGANVGKLRGGSVGLLVGSGVGVLFGRLDG